MENAFAWFGYLMEWFGLFVPRFDVVPPSAAGYKYAPRWHHWARRYEVIAFGSGMQFWWPLTTEYTVYPVVFQTTTLPAQDLVTADDRTVAVGGLVAFEVTDVAKLLTTTGACTVSNYTDSRAGRIGEFHHSLSAILVEVDGRRFHLRPVHCPSPRRR